MSDERRYSIYHRIITVTILSFIVQVILMSGITYTRYRSGLRQADATFSTLMSRNELYINTQFESVKNIASSVGYSSDVQNYILNMSANERVRNYRSIKYMFGLLIDSNPAVRAIYIANQKGVFLEQGGYPYMFNQFSVDYPEAMKQTASRGFFSRIYSNPTDKDDETTYCIFFLPVNTLPNVSHAGNAQFYCAVLFDMAKLLETGGGEDAENAEILTYDGRVLFANRAFSGADVLLADLEAADKPIIKQALGRDYWIRSFLLDADTPLRYTFITPIDTLIGDVNAYVRFSIVMILIGLIITARLLYSVRWSILQPVRQMTEDMRRVTDESGLIRPSQAQELNVLTTGINQMLHKLRDMQKQALIHQKEYYQMSLEKTQAQMLGYRSQINPHFLFNTLECMCSMARYYGIEALEKLTVAMADSYRYVLRAPDFAPFEQEIAHAKNYMQVMDIRYPGRFNLQMEAQEAALSARVPSMLLQPLVENAVLHGFANYDKDAPCMVTIRAQADGRGLSIQVIDNGTGLSPKRLDEVRKRMYDEHTSVDRRHIALRNIYRRLRFAFVEDAQMNILSDDGRYTRVEIIIQFEKAE